MKFEKSGYDFFSETAELSRFVLLPNRSAAEAFFYVVFPYITNCIVVSGDGVFPEIPSIQSRALQVLAESRDARVVVFNPDTLSKIKVISDRLLLMDDYLIQDNCWGAEDRDLGFGLIPEKVAHFMNTFYRQWDKTSGDESFSFFYKNHNRFNWSKNEWVLRLLVGEFDPISLDPESPFQKK